MSATVTQFNTGTFSPGATSESWTTVTTNPETTAGIFSLVVDTSTLAAGDVYEVRLRAKVVSGGSQQTYWDAAISGVPPNATLVFPAFMLMHGWDVQMRQRAGTVRSFAWSVRQA